MSGVRSPSGSSRKWLRKSVLTGNSKRIAHGNPVLLKSIQESRDYSARKYISGATPLVEVPRPA